jgi:hypothetical protein
MHRIIRIKAYEAEHGPHFNDEHARKAVNKMENEDGTRGQHWSLEETTALANQYGIRLDEEIKQIRLVCSIEYGILRLLPCSC